MMRRLLMPTPWTAILIFLATPAWAQQDMSRFEDLFDQNPSSFRMRYGVTPYFEEPVKGQNSDFSLVQQDFSTSARVWNDDHNDIRINGGLRFEDIHTSAILPDTGTPFPDELWNIRLGATYRYLFNDRWALGGSVSVGSASDQPFHGSQEIVESLSAFLRMPAGERDALLFLLSYSNNRDYANSYPLPGVEYFYNPSSDFHAMVGFPMESLLWRPIQDLTFTFRYSLIHNIHALLTYRVEDPVRTYIGFDWNTEGFLLVDRPDPKDRFFYDEKRANGGMKLQLTEGVVLDVSEGYAFDRTYRESQHGLRSSFDRVDIQSGLYALVSLEFRLGGSRERHGAENKKEPDKQD